jgi:hypothetical protein
MAKFEKKISKKILKTKTTDTKEEKSDKEICYVLIKCKEPNEKGDMQVEMTYEGDPILASYLIESAQGMINP